MTRSTVQSGLMFSGSLHRDDGQALLIVGIHREELPFGERVVAQLAETGGLSRIRVLTIPEGISGQHPRADQRFQYELQHRAIYRQIRELAVGHRLLIDLHRGEDDHSCADVICADSRLLDCVGRRWEGQRLSKAVVGHDERVRAVQLTADDASPGGSGVAGRTVIPADVWNNSDFLFVGLEVYVPTAGVGQAEDWRFAASLVESIVQCAGGPGVTEKG